MPTDNLQRRPLRTVRNRCQKSYSEKLRRPRMRRLRKFRLHGHQRRLQFIARNRRREFCNQRNCRRQALAHGPRRWRNSAQLLK